MDNGFRKASARLKKLGQIEVSPERLRMVVEVEGLKMLDARRQSLLKPDWDASDCTVVGGKTQVLVGGDGVMVPVVTAAEKAKRRAGRRHVRRRSKARPGHRHRGAEQGWKTVPSRLKGSGMRWNLPNAEAMAALACVDQSNMLDTYWSQQRQRVA